MTNEYELAAQKIVDMLGEPAAREFLTLLDSDDAVRADAVRQFSERGGNVARRRPRRRPARLRKSRQRSAPRPAARPGSRSRYARLARRISTTGVGAVIAWI